MAARALGLDCGPMSGFDNAKVDEAFFAGTQIKSNFLINLGHGDPAKLFPRSPRLSFDEAARIAVTASLDSYVPIHPTGDPPMFKRIALAVALAAASTAAVRRTGHLQDRPEPHRRGRQLEPLRLLQPDRATSARSTASSSTTPTNVGTSKVEVTLPLSGLDAHVPDFNEHLRSADFFDAEKYPTITFKSTKVEAAGDKKLRVFGDLTLHGVTKPVVLDITINKIGEHPMAKRAAAGFDATTTIKRSDFGVDKYVPNVSDDGHHPHHHRGDGAEGRTRKK